MKTLMILFVVVFMSGCVGFRPNDKSDLTQGFNTYGLGRDLEVEYFESGKLKKVKATSNIGATIKAAGTLIKSAGGIAEKVLP